MATVNHGRASFASREVLIHQLPDELLQEIFEHVSRLMPEDDDLFHVPVSPSKVLGNICSLSHISRRFYRLGIPFLYRCPDCNIGLGAYRYTPIKQETKLLMRTFGENPELLRFCK